MLILTYTYMHNLCYFAVLWVKYK